MMVRIRQPPIFHNKSDFPDNIPGKSEKNNIQFTFAGSKGLGTEAELDLAQNGEMILHYKLAGKVIPLLSPEKNPRIRSILKLFVTYKAP